jgi:biopolymer transport protein ExbD
VSFRRRSSTQGNVDVSAFADVAFLLIIFFILTTTFTKTLGSSLEIPSGSADPAKKQEKQLTVSLAATEIRFGSKGTKVSMAELREALAAENLLARKPEQRIVILDSAANVPYERYFQVVMAVGDAGGVLALLEEE